MRLDWLTRRHVYPSIPLGTGIWDLQPPTQNPVATSSRRPCPEVGCNSHPKAAAQGLQGRRNPSSARPCHPLGAGSPCAKLLVSRAALHLLPTHLLFFGWYPQKEMFFSWKKWLHLFTYGGERERNRQSFPPHHPYRAAGLWPLEMCVWTQQ